MKRILHFFKPKNRDASSAPVVSEEDYYCPSKATSILMRLPSTPETFVAEGFGWHYKSNLSIINSVVGRLHGCSSTNFPVVQLDRTNIEPLKLSAHQFKSSTSRLIVETTVTYGMLDKLREVLYKIDPYSGHAHLNRHIQKERRRYLRNSIHSIHIDVLNQENQKWYEVKSIYLKAARANKNDIKQEHVKYYGNGELCFRHCWHVWKR